MPTCPGTYCRAHILATAIRDLDPETRHAYNEVLVSFLHMETRDSVSAALSQKALVERMRAEKHAFLQSTFKPAVNLVIRVALASQLKTVQRRNSEVKRLVGGRKCINALCPGLLDDRFTCAVCVTSFCARCEKEIAAAAVHECKPDDIASVEFVASLVRCPNQKCGAPVIKSIGCNYMTCSVCRTNFDYVTGELSMHGNHTTDDKLVLRQPKTLVEMYAEDHPDLVQSLARIDAARPVAPYPFEQIVRAMMREPAESTETLAGMYARYATGVYGLRRYVRTCAAIADLHVKGGLTKEAVDGLIPADTARKGVRRSHKVKPPPRVNG